ncbi:collagen alpha-1(II) chain-like isoform X1 [Manacus candei]|uniref:collagen alpha-1(II) chain-like isoform X1 n=1 Tax=Manacus candei TaxID=415023 RepID=UPI002226D96D|nr:collagen alpha-1(II) chain-like isoform X1 [Manacus candei]
MEKAEMVLGRGKRKDRVKAAPIPQILFKNTGEDDLDMLISPDRRESSPGAPQIGLPAAAAVGGAGAAGAVVAPPGPAPAGQAGAVGGLPGAGMAAPGGVGISGGVGSGAAGAAPGTISTGLAAMATSTGAGTVGVTGAGATAAVAGGAGAVPTGGASVLTDLGGGAGAAPFPTPPPPEGEASILGGGGRKEEPREFPISASHEKGTETHRQGKPIPAAERREKRGLPPFDKDTEAEGSTLQKLQKVIELSRPIGLDTPAHPFQPGDWVYVKWWNSDPLRARWRGPYQVLLTSLTSVKVAGREPWFHYSRVKKASAPGTTNQTEPGTDDEDVE